MQKFRITQRDAKKSNKIVLAVPYGDLQHVLKYESPIAYNASYSWNFDLYELNNYYSIVTGYRGHGKACTHDLSNYPELKEALSKLEKQCYADNENNNQVRFKEKLVSLLEYHLTK